MYAQWQIFGLLAIVSLVFYNFIFKFASIKLSAYNNVQLISIASLIVVSIIWIALGQAKTSNIPRQAIWISLLAGTFWGIGQIFFSQMFTKGAPLSVGIPFFTGGLVLGSLILGIVVLREPLTAYKAIGVILILLGYFFVSKK